MKPVATANHSAHNEKRLKKLRRLGQVEDTTSRFPGLVRDIESCDFAVGDGWQAIIEDLCFDLDALCIPSLRVAQVKEKFGGLRFNVKGAGENPLVYNRILRAEVEAATTCEVCGQPGEIGQFLLALCPACSWGCLMEQEKT